MRISPFILMLTLLTTPAYLTAAQHNSLTAAEIADGWILLFDGQTLFGWQPQSKADWRVREGIIRVESGEPGLLCTTSELSDYDLHLEFRAGTDTNSGVFLRTPLKPADPKSDCYELNIATPTVSPFPTGSFVGRQKATSLIASDGWHTFDVTASGGRLTVKVDGTQVLDYTDPAPLPRGRIGLQLNKGWVEFRNIKLKPLSLASIFNGRDLSQWKVIPGKQSEFAVSPDGELTVKNGPGQLESKTSYADFVLQFEAITRGKHLNSGVFFRCIPGEPTQGYESQIHNGFRDGDRTKPIDFGTGGFYRRQPARRVVADDNRWFAKTLIVSGDHMAAWVDGYQVSDWTDTRARHENPRQGLRREAGTLSIQGHDPSTDLAFRKLQAVELPPRPPK